MHNQFNNECKDFTNDFKNNKLMKSIVQNCDEEHGIIHLQYIKDNYKDIYNKIDFYLLKVYDLVGEQGNEKLINGVSPKVISYLREALFFCNKYLIPNKITNINNLVIVGGGYGMEAAIIYYVCSLYEINIKKIIGIDMENVAKLQNIFFKEIQLEKCSTMTDFRTGDDAPLNNSIDTKNIVHPEGVSVNDSVRCLAGEGGNSTVSKMGSQASDASKKLGPKTTAADKKNFTIYRVMENYALRPYPDGDPVVPLSWNDGYMNIKQTYKDCSSFTFGPTLTMNTNNNDTSIEYTKNVINNIARYIEIYNLTNLNDISGNMITLQNDLEMMLLGKLKTGTWGKNDLMLVNQDIAKVKDDLDKKNTAYATNLSKEISDEIQSMIFNIQDNMWKPFKNSKIYVYKHGEQYTMKDDGWVVYIAEHDVNHTNREYTWTWIYDEDNNSLSNTYNKNDDIKAGYKSGRLMSNRNQKCLTDGDNGNDHWSNTENCASPKTQLHLFSAGPYSEATGDDANILKKAIILQSNNGRCLNFSHGGYDGWIGSWGGCNFAYTDELLLAKPTT
jgi:hypothetical protein